MIDWTQMLGALSLVLMNGVLVQWVWKVNNRQYESLIKEFQRYKEDTGKRIDKLESDLLESNKKAAGWFKKFYCVASIIEQNRCKPTCNIYNKYLEFQKENGELK